MKIAYCDMTKQKEDTLMQTDVLSLKPKFSYSLGAAKCCFIKQGPITHFAPLFEFGYVNASLNEADLANSTLGFDHVSGVFRPPLSGTYVLTYSGTCTHTYTEFRIFLDGSQITYFRVRCLKLPKTNFPLFFAQR